MSLTNYSIIGNLGSGASSVVYLAERKQIGVPVALKCISRKDCNLSWVGREINCQKKCAHPNIIELFEVLEASDSIYLATEYAANGSLSTYLQDHGPMREDLARRVFSELVDALDYLHNSMHIIHRDIKADNVMLDEHWMPKLADFGYSKSNTNNEVYIQTACGSPVYVAPEVCKREPYSYSADIWSLGVLLFFMVCGYFPFYDDNIMSLMQRICEAPLVLPDGLSDGINSLLKRMLTKNPKDRITIGQIKKDPWILAGHFTSKAEWYSHEPEERAMGRMVSLGYSRSKLLRMLKDGQSTDEVVLFRILRNYERRQCQTDIPFPSANPRGQQISGCRKIKLAPIPISKHRANLLVAPRRYSARETLVARIVVPNWSRRGSC